VVACIKRDDSDDEERILFVPARTNSQDMAGFGDLRIECETVL